MAYSGEETAYVSSAVRVVFPAPNQVEELLAAGRFRVDGLITHRFTPDAAAEAYDLTARQRAQTMGVLFDWSATAN
jgi:threonine dehydrogenase-like Zn-dependent dehydrogenase